MITLDQIKQYLRYETADASNDDALGILLNGGRRHIENATGVVLGAPRAIVETPARFPAAHPGGTVSGYDLRWRPADAESIAVTYLDAARESQSFEGFTAFAVGDRLRLLPASAWPDPAIGIVLAYQAGYEDADAIPEDLLHALCLYCGMSDADRASQSGAAWSAIDTLMEFYRLPVLV